jgi:quercetin dioxygenase-like cupin family protein
MENYTKAHFDFDEIKWLLSPRKKLGLSGVALGIISLPPGEGYSFTHSHREQEEVYVVTGGNGLILIDNETMSISRGDIIRVSPGARRALKAGDQGVFIVCAGGTVKGYPHNPRARYLIDDGIPYYDDIPPWYEGRVDIQERNRELKKRFEKSKKRREGE